MVTENINQSINKPSQFFTIPVSKELIDGFCIHKDISPAKLSLEQVAGIALLTSISKIISRSVVQTEIKKLIDTSFEQLVTALSPYKKENYADIIDAFDDLEILSNVVALKKLGFQLEEKQLTREVQPKIDENFSAIMGKHSEYNVEQHRLTSFMNDRFEGCLDVQGIAGSGKTSVLYSLARAIRAKNPNAAIVWITRSEELKYRVNNALGSGCVIPITYTDLCEHFLPPESQWGNRYRLITDYHGIMQEIGIFDEFSKFGNTHQVIHSAKNTFNLVELTIKKYCSSTNKYIDDRHVPNSVEYARRKIIRELAIKYWLMITNNQYRNIPVEPYHHVKYVQLHKTQLKVTEQIHYLLIDEAQELPPSVMNIVNYIIGKYSNYRNSATEGSIILGDKFQAMESFNGWVTDNGIYSKEKLVNYGSRKYLTTSERFGSEISSYASSMLSHGDYLSSEIQINGTEREDSRVLQFDWNEIDIHHFSDERPIVFLGLDLWPIFELTQRFVHAGISTYLAIETSEALKHLVSAAIDFRNDGAIYHPEFVQHKTWKDYIGKKNTEVLGRIDALFCKGYQKDNLKNTLEKASVYSQTRHTISLIEHYKGLENRRVALLPSSQAVTWSNISADNKNILTNKLYTGITRARNELLVPKGFNLFEI